MIARHRPRRIPVIVAVLLVACASLPLSVALDAHRNVRIQQEGQALARTDAHAAWLAATLDARLAEGARRITESRHRDLDLMKVLERSYRTTRARALVVAGCLIAGALVLGWRIRRVVQVAPR